MQDSQRLRFGAIDGLRGLAILMVIYQHGYATAVKDSINARGVYAYIIGNGWLGVGLFFMLSGFVLSLPYFSSSRTMEGRADILRFLSHRANRLLPLFVFMAFVSYAFAMAVAPQSLSSLAMILTTATMLTKNSFFPPINGPFWSLGIEIWFCLFFPWILIAMKKYGIPRTVMAIIVFSFAVRIPGAYASFGNIHVNPLKDSVLARLDDFAIGMLIAWLYANGRLKIKRPIAVMMCGLIVLIGVAIFWDLRVQDRLSLFLVPVLNNGAQLGFGLLIVSGLATGSWPNRIFSIFWFRVLGVMCFSIYCWHGLLLKGYMWGHGFSLYRQIEYWLVLLVLAGFTYRFIEFRKAPSLKDLFKL